MSLRRTGGSAAACVQEAYCSLVLALHENNGYHHHRQHPGKKSGVQCSRTCARHPADCETHRRDAANPGGGISARHRFRTTWRVRSIGTRITVRYGPRRHRYEEHPALPLLLRPWQRPWRPSGCARREPSPGATRAVSSSLFHVVNSEWYMTYDV